MDNLRGKISFIIPDLKVFKEWRRIEKSLT
jgi:hypothetical protein